MAKHLCHNITSGDENNYSAPVPIIGLYIAGASLVCLLLLISDMIHGIRHRKSWLPCRWFSLNSITLTLFSVAAKLPVDLTTPMPGVWDQLSKLTDAKINSRSFKSRKKLKHAKGMWKRTDGGTFDEFAEPRDSRPAMSSELDRAHLTIAQLAQLQTHEVRFVMDFINGQECTTVQELFTRIEQLLVDMLHRFLMQLPQATCKEVTECPAEEFTKKVKLMLKFISQVEPLEGKVEWLFLVGSGITSLISTPASSTDDHDNARRENEDGSNVDAARKNDGCNVTNNAHEIAEV